jgi:subfamily B ATP-binding cassette protein MsbA
MINRLKKGYRFHANWLQLKVRLQSLWPYFGHQQWHAWLLVIGTTSLAAATEPLLPALMRPLLDQGFSGISFSLWLVPLALLSLFTVRGLAHFIAEYALARINYQAMGRLRNELFAHLLQAHPRLFAEQSSSSLANVLVYEIHNGSSLLVNAVLSVLKDSISLVALLAYLFYLNWQLALVMFMVFPSVAWVMKLFGNRLHRVIKTSQSATDELAYVVEENVLAYRVIRLHAAQEQQKIRFDALGHRLKQLGLKATIADSAMTPLTQWVAALAASVVICLALSQNQHALATQSTLPLTVGNFASFVTAMLMLVAPIKHLSEAASPITRGLAAIERGLELKRRYALESSGTYRHVSSRTLGILRFEHVSVHYPTAEQWALRNVCLSIEPGQVVALVGASGSGKTTLAHTLARFVDLTEGRITLDGHAIQDWDLGHLRQQLAYVGQDVIMLNDSLLANITLGLPVDRDRVINALLAAHLKALIDQLPMGLDSPVGHNACQLSGGQRQRLAIARAIYKNAPILVLDEATSALDSASEHAVQEALTKLMQGRTTLMIAHRLHSIMHADLIAVFSQGQIVETGTHSSLMQKMGTYAHLANLQQRGFS